MSLFDVKPKYAIEEGRIMNCRGGSDVPEDEPVFILRAKDRLAPVLIGIYSALVSDLYRQEAQPTDRPSYVENRRRAMDWNLEELRTVFEAWQRDHPDRVKTPD